MGLVGAPAGAWGGAWTLPQGTGQVIETLYGWTGFGPPWGGNPPANQSRFDAQTYVQFGLTDSLTAFGETAFELFGPRPEAEALVDGRMGVLGRGGRVHPRLPTI